MGWRHRLVALPSPPARRPEPSQARGGCTAALRGLGTSTPLLPPPLVRGSVPLPSAPDQCQDRRRRRPLESHGLCHPRPRGCWQSRFISGGGGVIASVSRVLEELNEITIIIIEHGSTRPGEKNAVIKSVDPFFQIPCPWAHGRKL